jgi:hypothetical protein
MLHAFRVRLAIACPVLAPARASPQKKKKKKEKEKNRAEQEARRTSDGSGYAARMACTLKEDPEDGKETVSAGKLGGNASGRSAQQSPCWSLTSCGLL